MPGQLAVSPPLQPDSTSSSVVYLQKASPTLGVSSLHTPPPSCQALGWGVGGGKGQSLMMEEGTVPGGDGGGREGRGDTVELLAGVMEGHASEGRLWNWSALA